MKLYEGNEHLKDNLDLMLKYLKQRAKDGCSDETVLTDAKALVALSKSLYKPLKETTAEDIDSFFDTLEELSKTSIALYKQKIALFLRFAGREDLAVLCKTKVSKSAHKLPEDLLTQEEVEKLIEATQNFRDAAFIALLYESGARRGELLELQIKHIAFDDDGAVVTLPKGKTGPRRIRIFFASSFLHNWINHHPTQDDRNAWLWLSFKDHKKTVEYITFRDMLQRTAKQAGIRKKVNFHAFRHARATHLANDLTEQQLKIYLGWKPGSNMAATYVHLSGKDVDAALYRAHGIEVPKTDNGKSFKMIKCPRCKEIQDSKSTYCYKCGMPLTSEAKKNEKSTEDIMKQILLDPEIMNIIVQRLQAKTD